MSHRAAALAAVALLGGLYEVAPARAGSESSLIVIPSPASGPVLSYFKLSIGHGHLAQAGTIALLDDGVGADEIANDGFFSGSATVSLATAAGTYNLPVSCSSGGT